MNRQSSVTGGVMQNLRKTIVVKKGFQYRFMLITLLIIFIVTNVTGGTVYFLAGTDSGKELVRSVFNSFGFPPDMEILLPAIIFSQLIAIVLVGYLCNRISNKIAGPVYRMEKALSEMSDGNLSNQVKLRKADEFAELADNLNSFRGKLVSWLTDTQKILFSSQVKKKPEEAIEALKKQLSFFNLNQDNINHQNEEEQS